MTRAHAPDLWLTVPARRSTRERSAQRGSATSGRPSASVPSAWISRSCARSIGSSRVPSPRRRVGSQRPLELPVGVHAARAAGLDEQVARPLGEERPQRVEPVGAVDVDPQEAGRADGVLAAARAGARRDADEDLLARRRRGARA